jgi:hypothetical protein
VGSPFGSFLPRVLRFLPLSRSEPYRSPSIPHLAPPFSFPLGTALTQLEILFLLEPLGLRPNGFSPSFSLLMSTFSILIALVRFSDSKSYRLRSSRSTERSTTFCAESTQNHRFGFLLSLLYLWRKIPPLVRCYAFFNGWLLPSPPPSCLRNLTSFRTEKEIGGLID